MIKVTNIEWDFDDVDIEAMKAEIEDLPDEVDIPGWAVEDCNSKEELMEAIEEYLSNEYFYCTNSFCVAG
jgi:hypothetical protein